MQVRSLDSVSLNTLIDCFNACFSDYMVNMPTDVAYYNKRWKAALVDYCLSFGMFDKGLLVGFIIHGIDHRQGHYIAFNTGTGVLPKYRNQKIVKKIYDAALPILKQNGITKISLEVIKTNTIAIKAYQGLGFEICKEYRCYKGELPHYTFGTDVVTSSIPEPVLWDSFPNQDHYCWDHHLRSMSTGGYEPFRVMIDDRLIGYFTLNTEKHSLAQFDIFDEDPKSWKILFNEISKMTQKIKLNNVDASHTQKIQAIDQLGLDNYIDQYEMERLIDL